VQTLPSTESLRCFVEAARLLRFREAARSVALTPAAFGARIRQLEDQVGTPLFRRTTRVVTLTEAGLALLPEAKACIEAADRAVRAARGETGPQPLEIVLGTRHELGFSWVLPQLQPLSVSLPWLQLHLYFGSGPDLLLRVRTAEIDCAITSTRFSDPRLDAVPVHREDYVFVGAKRLLRKTPFSRAEHARSHTLLDASADLPLFAYIRDAEGAKPMHFERIVRLGSIGAIRVRVLEGAGVAVLPLYQVQQDLKRGSLVRLLPRLQPLSDYFRMVFRALDPRRTLFERLAQEMAKVPLR
jgi:LysR family transcriptional regulator, glycine cleavage system transcriptional activator